MSGFLLDTNIPSELMRSRPESRVEAWIQAQPEEILFLSVVTIGQLRRGFALLPPSKRRAELEDWMETVLLRKFRGRNLPLTHSIADLWGTLDAKCQLLGRPLTTPDGMIAATAFEHDLTVVTRNIRDFTGTAVPVFNSWE